jgi:hypothetical protein
MRVVCFPTPKLSSEGNAGYATIEHLTCEQLVLTA